MIDLVDVFEICLLEIFAGDRAITGLTVSIGNYVDNIRNSFCGRDMYLSKQKHLIFSCTEGSLFGRYVNLTMYDNDARRQLRLKQVNIWASP